MMNRCAFCGAAIHRAATGADYWEADGVVFHGWLCEASDDYRHHPGID